MKLFINTLSYGDCAASSSYFRDGDLTIDVNGSTNI